MKNPILLFLFVAMSSQGLQLEAQTCTGIYVKDFYEPGLHTISGTIKSSNDPLNSIKVSWQLNGGEIKEEIIVEFDSYQDGSSKYYNVFTTIDGFLVDDYQENEIEIWLTEPDGEEDEDITPTGNIYAFERTLLTTQTSILLEEVTATHCGWCPEAHYRSDVLEDQYADQLIAITLHQNDGMNSDNVDDVVDEWDIPRPRGMFNRMYIEDDVILDGENASIEHRFKFWDDLMRFALTKTAPVAMAVETDYDDDSKILTVDAGATFIREMEGDFRFNCFIVQNTFSSDDPEFSQDNNYYNDDESPFYNFDDPINNYEHKRWVREILGGAWGEENSIEEEVFPMSEFTHSWTYELPDDFDEDEMTIVVVVQEYHSNNEKRPILNSISVAMGDNHSYEIVEHNSSTVFEVDVKILLEGAYQENGTMASNLEGLLPNSQPYNYWPYEYYGQEFAGKSAIDAAIDWVLVELRKGQPQMSGNRNTITIDRKAGLLQPDGSIIGTDGALIQFRNLAKDEEYRFCIRHRNHLDILSDDDFYGNELMEVDLRSNPNGAWGIEQLKESDDGYYLMHAGDFNQDGTIQTTDLDLWLLEPAAVNIYSDTDGNLDATVQNTDSDLWLRNKAKIGSVEIQY